jgi:hypothetical protein
MLMQWQVWKHLVRSCREGNGHNLEVLRAVIDVGPLLSHNMPMMFHSPSNLLDRA